ncbi:hypothetical protein [Acidimangrovimonas pyrenivorans]|uniref:KfrA N-terminal DNA-binding domain-containing protein n=1 Tax=Acidimangrovimonas pyrenivorans TaxID=2030798 RepID=A0ABV7AGY9_9RHOB
MAKNNGGRPKGYSEAQLHETLEALLSAGIAGADLTAQLVKRELVDRHGVSSSVDTRTLEKAIADGLEMLRIRREDRFIAEVDEADESPLRELAAHINRAIRITVGKSRARHREMLNAEIEEQRDHVAELVRSNAELHATVKEQVERLRALEEEKAAWEIERDTLKAGNQELDKECHGLRAQLELLERMGVRGTVEAV